MKDTVKKTKKEKQEVLLRWLTPFDLEAEFGITEGNQNHMRREKRIVYSKVGGYIFYDRKKINQWLEDHEVDTAS